MEKKYDHDLNFYRYSVYPIKDHTASHSTLLRVCLNGNSLFVLLLLLLLLLLLHLFGVLCAVLRCTLLQAWFILVGAQWQ